MIIPSRIKWYYENKKREGVIAEALPKRVSDKKGLKEEGKGDEVDIYV